MKNGWQKDFKRISERNQRKKEANKDVLKVKQLLSLDEATFAADLVETPNKLWKEYDKRKLKINLGKSMIFESMKVRLNRGNRRAKED